MKKRIFEGCLLLFIMFMLLLGVFFFCPDKQNVAEGNEKRWLCIGDSITLGETNHNVSYADYVAKMSDIYLVKEGHSGYASERILAELDELDHEADIITIFIGTNDWVYDRAVGTQEDMEGTFLGRMNQLVQELKKRHPQSEIYLLTPLFRDMHYNPSIPFTGAVNSNGETVETFANAIKKCAEMNGVSVVDLYSNSGINARNVNWTTTDGTHPNFLGHLMIARQIRNIVNN